MKTQGSRRRSRALELAVIGAGPYGLSASAHLRAAGVDATIFGKRMAFWRRSLPMGMLLRSTRRSSSISDPGRALTLDRYEFGTGLLPHPLTLDAFLEYADWFADRVAPDVDGRTVVQLERAPVGFRMDLEDGETIDVRRVVVAAGIARFAWWPERFQGLPASLFSHSSAVRDVTRFAGRRVVVIGAGQSALEYAALLHEAGADVELIARTRTLRWLRTESNEPGNAGALKNQLRYLLYPRTEVGPPGLNWIAGTPDVFRRLPSVLQPRVERGCNFPVGASWLRSRVAGVTLSTGRNVASAKSAGRTLRITLDDGTERTVDHLIAATGYRVDVRRYDFIGPLLLRSLELYGGYPVLSTGLETSIPGLHFLGAPAALTFGPVMRFVTGTCYAAPALTRKITGKPSRPLAFSW